MEKFQTMRHENRGKRIFYALSSPIRTCFEMSTLLQLFSCAGLIQV